MQAELPPGTRQAIQQQGGLSSDTRAMMLFEANKKTALVAYILWFFLGLLGGHNFYLKRTGVAVAQLLLTLPVVGMVVTVVWVLVDAFLIPGWVRNQNTPAGGAARRLPARRGPPIADPTALARDLLRCPSVTPAEAGTLGLIEGVLKAAGFEVHRVTFAEPGTAPVENLYARIG